LVRALDERVEEFAGAVDSLQGRTKAVMPPNQNVHLLICLIYIARIGELREKASNYRAPIPWYERTVLSSKQKLLCYLLNG
jgi:hypothetical protein